MEEEDPEKPLGVEPSVTLVQVHSEKVGEEGGANKEESVHGVAHSYGLKGQAMHPLSQVPGLP